MCGICGYTSRDKSTRASGAILKRMADTLNLRGPDDEGYYLEAGIGLGHRRLSIIDLETGHQPMSSADGSITVVYNGEIYNFRELRNVLSAKGHVFRTRSDTEVLINAYREYGEDCLLHFNGMFAFALWDSKNDKLFLARDRFGKKPLYYAEFDNQFIFASELKAILKHPSVRKEIDLSALGKYLAYEYVPSPYTIFKNIYKLEPSAKLIYQFGNRRVEKYWDLDVNEEKGLDLRQAEEGLEKLFAESVRRRLVSDVDLGVFLSGGIDSSAVVAMMAREVNPKSIKTFSIGFKERAYDESVDARRVAGHFGTDHHEEILDPQAMLDVFPAIVDYLDEPFADSSIIPTYLVSKFTRKYVKVALGGDGGDELFLGYPSFNAHRLNNYLKFLPLPVIKATSGLAKAILPESEGHMNISSYARRFLKGMEYPEEVRQQAWLGAFTPDAQRELFLSAPAANTDPLSLYSPTAKLFSKLSSVGALERAMYIYTRTYMTDDILTKVDRAGMANSLEVRAPFLDFEFAEFAAKIPSSYKIKGSETKWILKRILKDKLPAETLSKRKRGFAVPVAKWLREDLRPMFDKAFAKEKIEREGIFDYRYIDKLTGDFLSAKRDVRKEIWSLFMFEMWYDKRM